jgi:phage FluMu gp28-like protein
LPEIQGDFETVIADPDNLKSLLLDYQARIFRDDSPLSIHRKSRRIGGTYGVALKSNFRRLEKEIPLYYAPGTDVSASIVFADTCGMWARKMNDAADLFSTDKVIEDKKITSLTLTYVNGAKTVCGASNPAFFRSKGGDVVLDEFDFSRNQKAVYSAAQASALVQGFQLRILSSCSENDETFYDQLCRRVESKELEGTIYTTTIVDAIDDGLAEALHGKRDENGRIINPRDERLRVEFFDRIRKTCFDEDQFQLEYMCKKGVGSKALLPWELIYAAESEITPATKPEDIKTNCPLYAGVDVGREKDLTVIWVVARVGDVYETVFLLELEKTPYQIQQNILFSLMDHGVRRMCIDATGIGDMLAEVTQNKYSKSCVEKVKFTLQTKSELAMPFWGVFDDRKIRIPRNNRALEMDLHAITKIVKAGNVRYDAERTENGHADRFWAGALAINAADVLKAPLPPPLLVKPEGW